MFPRLVVGTADFAVSSVVHFSVSETAQPVFKTQWEKWERALYMHRQAWGGPRLRRRMEDVECTPISLLGNLLHQTQRNWAFRCQQARGARIPQASLADQPE